MEKKTLTIFKPPVTDFNGVHRSDDNDFIIKRAGGHDDNDSTESLSSSLYPSRFSFFRVSAAASSIFKIK